MSNILKNFEKFGSKQYFYGLKYEHGLNKDQNRVKAYKCYLKGATTEFDHACASKLLLYHIEPTKLNNDLPDYNVEMGVKIVLDVFLHNGIYEIYSSKMKSMDLLYFFYIQMDLSMILREYVVDACKKIHENLKHYINSKNNSNFRNLRSSLSKDEDMEDDEVKEPFDLINYDLDPEQHLHSLLLYILCQPMHTNAYYTQAIQLVEEIASKKEKEENGDMAPEEISLNKF